MTVALVVLVSQAACKKDKPESAPAPADPPGDVAPTASSPDEGPDDGDDGADDGATPGTELAADEAADRRGIRTIDVYLDEELVGSVTREQMSERVALEDIIGERAARDSWIIVEARGPRGQYLAIPKPANKKGDRRARFFVGPDEQASFGVFAGDAERPISSQNGINRVDVLTKARPKKAAADDEEEMTFALVLPSGDRKTLGQKQLAPIRRLTPPVGDTETQGWSVRDVADALAEGKWSKAVVKADGADQYVFTRDELDPAKKLAFLKYNRRGILRFRVYESKGGRFAEAGELRGVSEIVLSE